ncbi:MAG: Maf family protein [Anaerolineae bacterium]
MSRPPVVLASASPRRHQLLKVLGVPFVVHTADVDEVPLPGEAPEQTAARLSRAKASVVADRVEGVVVAADTLVVLDDEVLGKPANEAEAGAILRRLRRRSHRVLTGLTVQDTGAGVADTVVVWSEVWMRDYSDAEIAAYVAGGDPMDKAGAYAIQHSTFMPVARLVGCPANVMGLPTCRVDEMLRARGLTLEATPTQSCQPARNRCVIRDLVFRG